MRLAHGGTSKHRDGRPSSVSLTHCVMWGERGREREREREREKEREGGERGGERKREGEREGWREREREIGNEDTVMAKLKIPEPLESDVQAW